MSKGALRPAFLRDVRAQALTEFVLVMPIILFFFLALVQYLMVAQASQLGNYAAYAALRSYVVHMDGENDPETMAQLSAAMIYSPISNPFPREDDAYASHIAGVTDHEMNMAGTRPHMASILRDMLYPFADIAWARLGFHQRGLELHAPPPEHAALNQRTLILTYYLPLWLPGFRSLWNFIAGESLRDSFSVQIGGYPSMPIRSKCTMGLERWSGQLRFRKDLDNGSTKDSVLTHLGEAFVANQEELERVVLEYRKADEDVQRLHERYQSSCGGEHATSASCRQLSHRLGKAANERARLIQELESDKWKKNIEPLQDQILNQTVIPADT